MHNHTHTHSIEITNEMIDKEASAMIESFGEMGVDYDQDTVREQAEELITSKAIIGRGSM
eukprot:1346861-Amorphochlora_amoeboformis.AAC.1